MLGALSVIFFLYCIIRYFSEKGQDEKYYRERDALERELREKQKLYSSQELEDKITYFHNNLMSSLRIYLNNRDMIIHVLGDGNLMFRSFEECRDIYMAGNLEIARLKSEVLRESKPYRLMVALSLSQSGFIPSRIAYSNNFLWMVTEPPHLNTKTAATLNQEMCTILRLIEKNMAAQNKPTHFDVLTNDKYDYAGKQIVVREFYEFNIKKDKSFSINEIMWNYTGF